MDAVAGDVIERGRGKRTGMTARLRAMAIGEAILEETSWNAAYLLVRNAQECVSKPMPGRFRVKRITARLQRIERLS